MRDLKTYLSVAPVLSTLWFGSLARKSYFLKHSNQINYTRIQIYITFIFQNQNHVKPES